MQASAPTKALDSCALQRARALPARYYFGEQMLSLERQHIFRPSWQMVAHGEQLAEPGDHVVTDVAGTSVLLLRGHDRVLRAFANVCRHRAGPLALCSGKGMGNLRCKYHGWLYNQDGQLIAAPEMHEAEDFRVEEVHLPRLRLHEWQGLVFVSLSDASPDFAAVFGSMCERIAPIDLDGMRFTRRDTWDVACNWKVYVDNFLEGYHVPTVHPALAQVLDYREYHTELYPYCSVQHSPLRNSDGAFGDGEALYCFVFPNMMFNFVPGRLQFNRILPLTPDRCRVEFEYFYAQAPEVQARIEQDRVFNDSVQGEDVRICEWVQKGLASGYYEAGRLCPRREGGVWHFHELLRAAYALAPN